MYHIYVQYEWVYISMYYSVHVHVYIVPTMLTELLYPLQYDTPLHLAAKEGHTTCVEYLLSFPGIDVDTAFQTIFK